MYYYIMCILLTRRTLSCSSSLSLAFCFIIVYLDDAAANADVVLLLFFGYKIVKKYNDIILSRNTIIKLYYKRVKKTDKRTDRKKMMVKLSLGKSKITKCCT